MKTISSEEPDIINVVGPVVYAYYNLGGKRIYLFGERHVSPKCFSKRSISFPDFLSSLIQAFPEKRFDLYLEVPYYAGEGEIDEFIPNLSFEKQFYLGGPGTISSNYRLLNGCFSNGDQCQYSNIRGHSIDFRRYHCDYKQMADQEFINHLLDDPAEVALDRARLRFNNPKILKQYQKIASPELREAILNFFDKEFNRLSKIFIKNFRKAQKNPNEETRFDANDSYIDLKTVILDKFMVGKIFKESKHPKENIITYTGAYHTRTVLRLFKALGLEPEFKDYTNLYNCVKVDLKNFD